MRFTEKRDNIAKQDTQSNKYQLTINNPLDKDFTHEKIFEEFKNNFKTLEYLCMADETGLKEETPHTHVFVCFSSRVRFSMLKKHFPEAHIERCRGLVSENVNYIRKAGKWKDDIKHGTQVEGSFEEYGQKPPDSKGMNTDLSELYHMINDGMTNAEILACNQDYIMQIDKLDKIRTIVLQDRYKDEVRLKLKVAYIYGETGTGKTRSVLEKHGNSNVYRVTDYQHPFDGYNCQPVICFDEFRSSLMIKEMLNYCDIYPIELPARYANKFACYETVYIISNWALEKQYSEIQKDDKESWNAFLRRIHKIQVYTHEGTATYNSVQEYFGRENHFHSLTDTEMKENPFIQGKLDLERQAVIYEQDNKKGKRTADSGRH